MISEQVGAVHVAQLGRDQAVDEPGQVQDFGRVLDLDAEPGPAEQHRPAQPAQGETRVEHDERDQHEDRVGTRDQLGDLGQGLAVERNEEADDRERDEDRDDGPRLAKPAAQRQPLDGVGVGVLVPGLRGIRGQVVGLTWLAGVGLAGVGLAGVGHVRLTHAAHPRCPGAAGPRARCPGHGSRSWRSVSACARYTTSAPARSRHWSGRPAVLLAWTDRSRPRCRRRPPRACCAHPRRQPRADPAPSRRRPPARCRSAHDPGVAGLDPVHQLTDGLEPRVLEHRAPVPVERMGNADQAPLRAYLGDRSRAPASRATARSRKSAMRSPSAVLTSSPTMIVNPSGAASGRAAPPRSGRGR